MNTVNIIFIRAFGRFTLLGKVLKSRRVPSGKLRFREQTAREDETQKMAAKTGTKSPALGECKAF